MAAAHRYNNSPLQLENAAGSTAAAIEGSRRRRTRISRHLSESDKAQLLDDPAGASTAQAR